MAKFKNFIFDVDGVFTDGKFHYSEEGKLLKVFGDADNDALSILKQYMHIEMVTGDKRGFPISKKRIHVDMGYPISLVSTFDRKKWIEDRFDLAETIYMGDGLFDVLVFEHVGYSIAPENAFYNTKNAANWVTTNKGGEGAVAEACFHVLADFFNKSITELLHEPIVSSGNWKAE